MLQMCAWCRGEGKWNIALGQSVSCVVCGGTGKIAVIHPPVYCTQCQGTGRENATNPCLICAGTGWEGVLSE